MINNTKIAAMAWIDKVIAKRGLNEAFNLMEYNVSKNPYFQESNEYISQVWIRLWKLLELQKQD